MTVPAQIKNHFFPLAERNGSWTPKKGDQRKCPLDSSQRREPKGAAWVAACAVRRGLESRISLPLHGTSDRDFSPLLHAARCPLTCHRLCTGAVPCAAIAMPSHRAVQQFIALAPFLSSTGRPKGLASRRGAVFLSARRKKDRGAHYAGHPRRTRIHLET